MTKTLGELAALVGGRLNGDSATPIHGADIIRDAAPGQITLADDARLASDLEKCPAAAVVVPMSFQPAGIAFVAVADVHAAFAKIVRQFRHLHPARPPGISEAAWISESARIANDVVVEAGATIEEGASIGEGTVIHGGVRILRGCQIGAGVVIYPNAVLYENTIVRDRVIIHAGAVIGAFGFGYQTVDDAHQLSSQLGWVEIDEDVELGACTTIDRGTYGATRIGPGTKIDNQVQIGHNCRIGAHNLLCAQVGLAGSCTTGDHAVLAGQVGLADHVDIGNRALIAAQSGLMHNVPDRQAYMGTPAVPIRDHHIRHLSVSKLPELRKQVKQLAARLEALESQSDLEDAA